MIDRRGFVAGSLALGGCAAGPRLAAPIAPPLWGQLRPGPYAPGLDIDWKQFGARRLQRWRWFPAVADTGEAMTVRDLGGLYVEGGSSGWPSDPRAIYATGYDEPGDAEKLAKLLDIAISSRANARPAKGRFPLVMLGQGFGFESPFHQHVLAEYLATWGYRIVTAPLTGAAGPKADVSPETFAAQIADLLALAGSEDRDSGLALVGYDLGGMAVAALAGEDLLQADLVIGIDSGVMSERLVAQLMTSRPTFGWQKLTMPYVHCTRTAAENEARKLHEYLRIFETGGGAPRALVRIPQMRHADFGAIGAIENVHPGLFGPVQGAPALGYANALFLIRDALDHFIRNRSRAAWRPPVQPPITVQSW